MWVALISACDSAPTPWVVRRYPHARLLRPATRPGRISVSCGSPNVVALHAHLYPGHPRRDEDTRGDRLDWLLDCLLALDKLLGPDESVTFIWSADPDERAVVEDWARDRPLVWVIPPRAPTPAAAPPTRKRRG